MNVDLPTPDSPRRSTLISDFGGSSGGTLSRIDKNERSEYRARDIESYLTAREIR